MSFAYPMLNQVSASVLTQHVLHSNYLSLTKDSFIRKVLKQPERCWSEHCNYNNYVISSVYVTVLHYLHYVFLYNLILIELNCPAIHFSINYSRASDESFWLKVFPNVRLAL